MYDRRAQLDCWRNPQGSRLQSTQCSSASTTCPLFPLLCSIPPPRVGILSELAKTDRLDLPPMRWQLQTFICQILISNLYLWKSVLMLLLLDPTNQIQKASKLFEHLKHSPDELTRKPPNRKIRQKICKQVLSAGSTWAHRGAIVRSLLDLDGPAIWRRMFKTN